MDTKQKCWECGSVDVVGYFPVKSDREPAPPGSLAETMERMLERVHRDHYPAASRCMDCGHVMPFGAEVAA